MVAVVMELSFSWIFLDKILAQKFYHYKTLLTMPANFSENFRRICVTLAEISFPSENDGSDQCMLKSAKLLPIVIKF